MGNKNKKIKVYLLLVGDEGFGCGKEEESPFEQLEMDFVRKYLDGDGVGDKKNEDKE